MSRHDALYISKFQSRRKPRRAKVEPVPSDYIRRNIRALRRLAKKAGMKFDPFGA